MHKKIFSDHRSKQVRVAQAVMIAQGDGSVMHRNKAMMIITHTTVGDADGIGGSISEDHAASKSEANALDQMKAGNHQPVRHNGSIAVTMMPLHPVMLQQAGMLHEFDQWCTGSGSGIDH